MAKDEQDRLRKLAELRDQSVLSEEEYRSARARLVATGRRQAERTSEEEDDDQSRLRAFWPAFLGLAVLIVLIVGVVVYGRMAAERDADSFNVVAEQIVGSNMLDVEPDAAQLCASADTYARIRDAVFERAQQQYGGNPAPLASLRQSVGVRMQYPMLRAVQKEVGRTDCSGHLVLDLPPPTRGAFDGLPVLEADLEYGVQDAAGGSRALIELTGADEVIRQLAVAANLVVSRASASPSSSPSPSLSPAAEPLVASSGPRPSFSCAGSLSDVEHLICSDEELAHMDREVAALFRSLREQLGPDEWDIVSDGQRRFLRRRSDCPDVSCVRGAYASQARFLKRFRDGEGF